MGSWQSKPEMEQNNFVDSDEDNFLDAVDELNTNEMGTQNKFKNFQTDAVESRRPNLMNPIITYETMRAIENELTYYEKVSLAFLIFDQEDIALQSLLVEKDNLIQQSTTNLLLQWAQSESSWKNKIIEGLAIIQNYSILERLGYNKEDIKSLHLPTSPYTSSYINIVSKALYRFAESITIDEIRLFLKLLESDFQKKGLRFIKFDDVFVEMYLLQCFSVKYIKKNDVSNLIGILKKMELHQQIDMLETTFGMRDFRRNTDSETIGDDDVDKIKKQTKQDCVFDLETTPTKNKNINTTNSAGCSVDRVRSSSSLVETYPSEYQYEVDLQNVGICLIINQYKFYVDDNHPDSILIPEVPLENRDGTEFDRNKLKDTFTKYNFRIIIEENLTNTEMKNVIRDAMNKFSRKDSCFIVCILSHGEQDSVFGVNSIPVSLSELEDVLHDTTYTALLGKPKILIIQSCQGKPLQQVVSVEHNYVTDGVPSVSPPVLQNTLQVDGCGVPQRRDLLLLMSTITGFASVRDPTRGTWFIQELCNVIEKESDGNHIEDIMTMVTKNVSEKTWQKDKKLLTMVPQKKSTFSKKLFLIKVHKL